MESVKKWLAERAVKKNGVFVHYSPPKSLGSVSGAQFRQWARGGAGSRLERAVLAGQGRRLLAEAEALPLANHLPALMAKCNALHVAVERGSLMELQELLYSEYSKRKYITCTDEAGVGLLHKAVYYDYMDIAAWLVSIYPPIVHQKDSEGRTPLHYAAMCRDEAAAASLLEGAGAARGSRDAAGKTPAFYRGPARDTLVLPIVSDMARDNRNHPPGLVLKRSNIRIWCHDCDMARLQRVVWEGHGSKLLSEVSNQPVVKKFLEAVPYMMNTIRDLHNAVVQNDIEGVMKHSGDPIPAVILSSRDANNMTVFYKAAGLGHGGILRYITERYPEGVNDVDNEGRTPLHYAAAVRDDHHTFNSLVSLGADESIVDNKNKTPAYYLNRPQEIDKNMLKVIPEAPRTPSSAYPSTWDWKLLDTEVIADLNKKSRRKNFKVSTENVSTNNTASESTDIPNGTMKTSSTQELIKDLPDLDDSSKSFKVISDENDDNLGVSKETEEEEHNQQPETIKEEEVENEQGNIVDTPQNVVNAEKINENEPEDVVDDEKINENEPENVVDDEKNNENDDTNAADNEEECKENEKKEDDSQDNTNQNEEKNEESESNTNDKNKEISTQENNKESESNHSETENDPEQDECTNVELENPDEDLTGNSEILKEAENLDENSKSLEGNHIKITNKDEDINNIDEQKEAETGETANEGNHKSDDEDDDDVQVQHESNSEYSNLKIAEAPTSASTNRDINRISSGIQTDGRSTQESLIEGIINGEVDMDSQDASISQSVESIEGDVPIGDNEIDPEVTELINSTNMEMLAALVLNGEGSRLVGRYSKNSELQSFLDNVPIYMKKIHKVHMAAREGNIRDLQAALDRRKFAIARDPISPNGATPLHVATVFGKTNIIKYLGGRFPETLSAVDFEGRTALHYAGVLPDNGHYYNLLQQLGANSKDLDDNGRSAEEYYRNKNLMSLEQLFSDFGITPDAMQDMLSDKVPEDCVSSRRSLDAPEAIDTLERCYRLLASARPTRTPLSASSNRATPPLVLGRFLRKSVFDAIKYRVTKLDHDLFDVIWPAVKKLPDNKNIVQIVEEDFTGGVTAPDYYVYTLYEEFLTPLIKDLHNINVHSDLKAHPVSDFARRKPLSGSTVNSESLVELNIDPNDNFVLSGTMECMRNIIDFELPLNLSVRQLEEVERIITTVLMQDEFSKFNEQSSPESDQRGGTYYTLSEVLEKPSEVSATLASAGLLITLCEKSEIDDCERLHGKHWPYGRGVYVSDDKTVAIWINVHDHLRVLTATPTDAPGEIGLPFSPSDPNGHMDIPAFKTDEGRYLAKCKNLNFNKIMSVDKDREVNVDDIFAALGDPLIKGLTEVANVKPKDPIAFLASFLHNFPDQEKPRLGTQESNVLVTHEAAEVENEVAPPQAASTLRTRTSTKKPDRPIEVITVDPKPEPSPDAPEQAFSSINRDEHGQSMLHFAAARSHSRNALFQLLQESDINLAYRDELYRTARDVSIQANVPENTTEIDRWVLHLAARGNSEKIMELLLEGYDHILDVVDEEGVPISEVISQRDLGDMSSLLASIPAFEDSREALHAAIRRADLASMKSAITAEGGRTLARGKNSYGRTALHVAVLAQHEDLVAYLAENCPELLRIGDNLERTPLHYAMGVEKMESLSRVLIRAGSKRVLKDLKGRQPSYYFMNKSDILRLKEEEEVY